MKNQTAFEDQIDTLRSKNKNCIVVMGGEPVVTNHTVSLCQDYFKNKEFGIETISINSTTKVNDLVPIFSDGSLFNNNSLYKIKVARGRVSEEVKELITQSIMSKSDDFYIINAETNPKDFKKSTWYKSLQRFSITTEANEPNSTHGIGPHRASPGLNQPTHTPLPPHAHTR